MNRRTLGLVRLTVVALIAILVTYLISIPAVPQEESENGLPPGDLDQVKEARRLVSLYGEDVWPGFGRDLPPVLLIAEGTGYLVGFPGEAPAGFRETEAGSELYRSEGEQYSTTSVETRRIAGRRTVVAPSREALGESLSGKTEEGRDSLGESDYVGRLIEGIFLAYRRGAIGSGEWPDSGSSPSSGEVEGRLEVPDLWRSRLAGQEEVLSRGLKSEELSEVRQTARKLVDLSPGPSGGTNGRPLEPERKAELLYGTARYAKIRILTVANREEGAPSGVEYPDPEALTVDLLEGLTQTGKEAEKPREWLAALGAAKGLLLDRLFPGWKEVASEGLASLNELLARTLELPEQLEDYPVTEVGVAGRDLTVALAEDSQQRQQGLMRVTDLRTLDGMVFYFPREVEGGFWMKNTKIPLQIGYFRPSGELARSLLMEPCRSESCPTYSPGKPYQYALELPQDAELQLADHPNASITLTYRPYDN